MRKEKKTLKSRYLNISLIFLVFILFVVLLLLFPFDLKNSENPREIVIKYADNISPAHQRLIDNFNKEYEGRIRVEPIDLPFIKFSTNERKELLTRSLRSKSDKLDVFAIDLIWTARFAKWSEPLDDYISVNEVKNLIPQSLESCIINKKLYALPMYLDISVLYYRKDILEKLPNGKEIESNLQNSISWDEFINLKSEINIIPEYYIFPADNFEGLMCSFVEILYSYDNDFFSRDKYDWNSEAVKKTFQFFYDITNKYNLVSKVAADYRENQCYDYFAEKDIMFLRGWASLPRSSNTIATAKSLGKKIGIAPLPHSNGNKFVSTVGGWNMMISKYSEHKKEAVEFLKYAIKNKSQKTLYEYGAFLPVLPRVYEDVELLKKYPQLEKNKRYLSNVIHRPILENYTKISDVITLYLNKVIKNKISVDEAVEEANKALLSGELILR